MVADQRRAGREVPAPPPAARSSKQEELDEEVRLVALDGQRRAALHGDVVAVLWVGDVGYPLAPEQALWVMRLRDAGLLEGAVASLGELPPVPPRPPRPPPGPVRYGQARLDAGVRDFHRAVSRLGWDTCADGGRCERGRPCARHDRQRRKEQA